MAKRKTCSANFQSLKEQYGKGYISKETLRGYVTLYDVLPDVGISLAEYEEITGEAY